MSAAARPRCRAASMTRAAAHGSSHATAALLVLSCVVAPAVRAQSPAQQPAEPNQDVIVVTAARKRQPLRDVTVATEVLSRAEIEVSGARDAAELLEERPGMYVSSGFAGTDVQLQGLDNKYVLILVDGERVTGRIDGSIDLSRYRADTIERIEIVRGPASALYGADAVGGVINIITRSAKKPLALEAHSTYGSRNRVEIDTHAMARAASLNARISGAFRRSDAYRRHRDDLATNADTFDETQVAGRLALSLGDQTSLQGRSSFRLRHSAGIDENGAGFISDRTHNTRELSASLGAHYRFSSGALSANAHYTRFDDRYGLRRRATFAPPDEEHNIDQLARLGSQLDLDIDATQQLSVGSELLVERLDSPRIADAQAQRARVALYAQHEWQPLAEPRLALSPGARLLYDTRFGHYATPRLAVRCDPWSFLAIRASFGWAFRAPSFKELALRFANESANYFVEGNPDLRPERSVGGTLGLELHPYDELWLSTHAYHNVLSQMINADVVDRDGALDAPIRYRYRNVARARTHGVDASARLRPLSGLELEGSYSWTLTFDRTQNRPLPARPRHRGTGRVTYRAHELGFSATVRAGIVGRQPFYDSRDSAGKPRFSPFYVLIDARVQQALLPWLSLAAGVNNALSAGNHPLLNLLPRSYYAGAYVHLPTGTTKPRG